jgi:hypothetical protein
MDRACSTLVRKVKSIAVYNSKPEERYLVRNPWYKRRDSNTKGFKLCGRGWIGYNWLQTETSSRLLITL